MNFRKNPLSGFSVLLSLQVWLLCHHTCLGKIHHLSFNDDKRLFIHLVDFGFLADGFFHVELSNFTVSNLKKGDSPVIGFTLSKGEEINQELKAPPSDCFLRALRDIDDSKTDIVYFIFDWQNAKLRMYRTGPSVETLRICTPVSAHDNLFMDKCSENSGTGTHSTADYSATVTANNSVAATGNETVNVKTTETAKSSGTSAKKAAENVDGLREIPLEVSSLGYSAQFSINFLNKNEEGRYYFIYHNCRNYGADLDDQISVSYKATIVAKNAHSFLSAGEISNPAIYLALYFLFFATALYWTHVLKTTKDSIYKIHYLMAALLYLKSFSLLFHGINFYFISTYGQQRAVWAVVYYIMHLLKGLLLFGVIILIGTGWTFFKNFLTDRDRKLFMIVIPLQVLDNIALIVTEESEIGQKSYSFWFKLFILIDLICCAAIILPVIWSIRYLQEASRTDGKAAFNLQKLKLFRHFYIIIICYIYLTRIVNYLFIFMIPFKFAYVVVIIVELGTWLFYVLTGYKFKPAPNNPYLKLSLNDEDEDLEDVILQSGALENIVRVNRPPNVNKQSTSARRQSREEQLLRTGEETSLTDQEVSHELD